MTLRTARSRAAAGAAAWWLAAIGLPVLALATVLVSGGHWRLWLDLPMPARSQVAMDTLLLEAALLVLAAPLGGVALTASASSAWRLAGTLCVGATLYASTSAVLALTVMGSSADSLTALAPAHATLWAATLVLAAGGALAASVFRDPLDAAACAVGVAVVAAAGVLVAGPGAINLPTRAVDAALQSSPIVAIAAAADIDLLRMEVLYRLSPLAHVRFDYPTWQATCGWYLGLAIIALVAVTRTSNRRTHA